METLTVPRFVSDDEALAIEVEANFIALDDHDPASLQCDSRLTASPLPPTRKSRSAPLSACRTWST
jgi:hypothetical protein